jgi:hypothetical protein
MKIVFNMIVYSGYILFKGKVERKVVIICLHGHYSSSGRGMQFLPSEDYWVDFYTYLLNGKTHAEINIASKASNVFEIIN